MHAALEMPDIRQYLTACHELFKFLLALQGCVHIRAVVLSDDRGAGRRPGAERGVPAVRRALGVPAPLVPTLSGPDQGQSGAPDPLHPLRASSTAARLRTTTISTSRPRAGWRARPMCAGTPRRGSAPSTASSATSGRCFSPWRTMPLIDISASARLQSLAPRLLPATVEVERRPLSVYAEALQ